MDTTEMKSGNVRTTNVLALAISGLLASGTVSAETKFTPLGDVSATWIDNLDLASEEDQAISEYVFQVNPGFLFEQTGQRFSSSIGYNMLNYFYADDSDRNSTHHQGNLDATLALVKEYFFIQASGSYSQQLIDPTQASTNNLMFETVNVTDTMMAQVSPYFHHEYDSVRVDVRYTRGIVKYDADQEELVTVGDEQLTQIQDVDTESRFATFGSADDQARLSWELRYEFQQAEYETLPRYRFESATGELGVLFGKSFRLIGRGGLESDPIRNTTEAGLDESHWEAGFRWQPSQRTLVQAFYGEHSYGETYNVRIERTARVLELSASYSEGPTTQAQELVLRPVGSMQDAEGAFLPGDENFNSITADVYLREDAEAEIRLKGQRTQLQLTGFQFKRTYINGRRSGAVEESLGASMLFTRSLASNLELGIKGSYSEAIFEVDPSVPPPPGALPLAQYEYHDVLMDLTLTQKLSDRVDFTLSGHRVRRTSDDVAGYTVHWVALGVKGEF